jgi:hypothetical protein
MADGKSLATKQLEAIAEWERSPFIRGLLTGAKGAIVGGAAGAAAQAIRGKSMLPGAILGALGTGLLAGAAKAAAQDISNQESEAALRYHAERIKTREPYFFLPKKKELIPLFRRSQTEAHRVDETSASVTDHSDNMRPTYSG